MKRITKVIGSGSGWEPELLMIKGESVVISVLAATPRVMDIAAFIVRLLKPEAYCFAAEGWAAAPEPGTTYRRGDVAKSEVKIEILMQIWCINGGRLGARIFTIDRVNNKLNPFEAETEEQDDLKFVTRLPSAW